MVIPLAGRQRWLFAGIAGLTLFYLFLSAKEFAASRFALRPDPVNLQRAVRLSPGNADYRHRLGRYYAFVAADPQASIDHLQAAVVLNPYQARYWFDLAAAHQVAGSPAAQRDALEHALRAEPTAPDVAWEAASFFLVESDIDRALREFRVVMENDPSLAPMALQACWRVRPDADALLQQVVPPRTDSLIAFLTLMQSRQETAGAVKAFDELVQLHQKFEPRYLFDYIRYLVLAHQPDAARAAWEQAAPVLGLQNYLPTDDNLFVNGDFSLDILNGGFDWSYQVLNSVHLQLDPSDFREGQRSLSISFEGPGISDAGIHQWIPVRAGASYDFTAYYKSAELQGAGGPHIVLRDAYTSLPVFTSDPLTDADFWKAVHGRFTVPNTASLLVVNIERIPAGSPIRGKLWLDDFQLAPQSAKDHS